MTPAGALEAPAAAAGSAAPAVPIDRAGIIAALEGAGTRRDLAALYADAFLEYREASDNIRLHGAMVLHPRTANPIENPYLKIRDRAFLRLRKMGAVKAAWLWE